jgi:hypothetical protein
LRLGDVGSVEGRGAARVVQLVVAPRWGSRSVRKGPAYGNGTCSAYTTNVAFNAGREDGWVGSWRGGSGWLVGPGSVFPNGCATSVAVAGVLRLQLPPVDPCMRFSRTRLTDVLHRRCSA